MTDALATALQTLAALDATPADAAVTLGAALRPSVRATAHGVIRLRPDRHPHTSFAGVLHEAVAPDGTRVAVGWTATRAAALRDAALALEAYALTEVTP